MTKAKYTVCGGTLKISPRGPYTSKGAQHEIETLAEAAGRKIGEWKNGMCGREAIDSETGEVLAEAVQV